MFSRRLTLLRSSGFSNGFMARGRGVSLTQHYDDWLTTMMTDWPLWWLNGLYDDWMTTMMTDWPLWWLTEHYDDWLTTVMTDWPLWWLTDHCDDWLTTMMTDWPLWWLTDHYGEWLTTMMADWARAAIYFFLSGILSKGQNIFWQHFTRFSAYEM